MIALGRTVPIALIFAYLALGFILLDLGFQLSERRWPDALPEVRAGSGYYFSLERKVAAAEYQLNRPTVDPDLPLAVIVGQSTLRSGISAPVLREADGIDCRYLVLGGAGGALLLLLKSLEPLRRSSLKPDVVVLGLHYFFLLPDISEADVPGLFSVPGAAPGQRPASHGHPALVRVTRFFQTHFRLAARRKDFTAEIDWWLTDLKISLARVLGISLAGPPIESIDPWSDYPPYFEPEHSDREALFRESVDRLAGTPQAYGRKRIWIDHLLNSIARLRARGAVVAILILPENSWLRAATPPEAREALVDPIRKAFPGPGVEFIDLNDLLPDSAFSDADHYNPEGRGILSRELATRIAAILRECGRLPA